jgi:hypothetical protein
MEKKVGGICFSLYVFQNLEKNPTKQESLVFLETTVQYVGESRKPTRNPRWQKPKCFGWISATKKDCAVC